MEKRKYLLCLLIVTIFACIFSGFNPAKAAGPNNGLYYEVNADGTTCTIIHSADYKTNLIGDLTIPSQLNGYQVTAIALGAFSDCDHLQNVTIPGSVETIGYWTFADCDNLQSITLLQGVKTIESEALRYSSLKSISIPASVTNLSGGSFYACKSLTSINVDTANPNYVTQDGVLYNHDKTTLICYPAEHPGEAFQIPNSVTTIGHGAFRFNSILKEVTIPESVKTVDSEAFNDCNALTKAIIPSSVTSIGNQTFYSCDALTYVKIPANITTIDWSVFEDCRALTSIEVDKANKNFTTQDGVLYNYDKTTLLHYPAGRPDKVFRIPNSVTTIAWGAFKGSALTCITIPSNVGKIEYSAFGNCTSLNSVYFDGSMPTMAASVFENGCPSLKCYYQSGKTGFSYEAIPFEASDVKTITLDPSIENGIVTPSTLSGIPGETVNLDIKPNAGYILKPGSLKYNNGSTDTVITDDSFTMPDKAITIYGEFIENVAPTASLTSPPGGGVPVSTPSITLNFSETVTGVTGKKVAISCGSGTYTYTIGASDSYITGTGSACFASIPVSKFLQGTKQLSLKYNTTYTVTLEAGAYTDAAGNKISAGNIGSLETEASTDTIRPIVSIVTPNGTSISISGNIVIQFSETMNTGVGSVSLDGGSTFLTGGSWSANKLNYTVPYSGLSYGTAYTVSISGFEDAANNIMTANSTHSFTTMAPPHYGEGSARTTDTSGPITITTDNNKTSVAQSFQATTGSDGVASVSVTKSQLEGIVKAASGKTQEQRHTAIEIDVNTGNSTKGISVTIPQAAGTSLMNDINALTVLSPVVTVTFDEKALTEISKNITGDITIKALKLYDTALSDGVKAIVGGRPIYDLKVSSGGKLISTFGNGTAKVSIPYKPAAREDTNKIVVYYSSDSGKLILVPSCVYDASTGTVTFKTTHFSSYAVSYNDVSFTDVSGWYADYVNYLSARGIVGGTGDGQFSPDANITRAQFVTILARMSGDDLSGYTSSAFTDVPSSDFYYVAVQWANKTGIAAGSDGKFDPNANITREQMAVMLYRYAKYVRADVSSIEGMSIRKLTDYSSISNYAMTPIQWASNNKIVSGNDDGSFAPQANATRAQAAKMIAILLQGIMKG